MKYYSEELKRFYDTEESLLADEEKARQKKESAKVTKAKYAKAIEDAEAVIEKATKDYDKAVAEVVELQKEYDAKVKEIMDPAVDALVNAKKARAEAITAFNDKYGVYTTTYTGKQALKEFDKFTKEFDKVFNNPFWLF